jgi:hypothetical protein
MDTLGIPSSCTGPLRAARPVVPLFALLLTACSNDPLGWFPGFTDVTVPGVSVTLAAQPVLVSRGDTVHFRTRATNATSETIQIGVECGPSMDVALIADDGSTRSALADILGSHGAFTCELAPHHFVDPHSTREQIIRWPAVARGDYMAVAGLRRSEGLANPSSPVRIIVR